MEIIPNPQIMLLVFVVFMITIFCMNKFVFVPLISFMDAREQKLAKDLQALSADDNEVQEIEKEIQAILAKAKNEAYTIKEERVNAAKENANAKILAIQNENKEKMDAFMTKLESSRDQMKADIKASLGDVESLLVTKIKNV